MVHSWLVISVMAVILLVVNLYWEIHVKKLSARLTLNDLLEKTIAYITFFSIAIAMDKSFIDAKTHWSDPAQVIVALYALLNEGRSAYASVRIIGLLSLIRHERKQPSIEDRVKTLEDEIERLKKVRPMSLKGKGMNEMKNFWRQTANRCRAIELYLGGFAVCWGAILSLPIDIFTSTKAYIIMAHVGSQHLWGLMALLIGVLQLIGMFRKDYFIKRISLILAIGMWMFVSTALVVGDWRTTATVVYPLLVCLSVWMYHKVGEQRYGR